MSNGAKLGEVSNIRTGHTFRGKIPSSEGPISVFQPKDIENGLMISEPIKVSESVVSVLHKHLLQSGDILLANKGIKFSSFLYRGSPSPAIASSAFFVIRPDKAKILPEYLEWFMGEPEVIDFMKRSSIGSTIPSLTLSVAQNIWINLPSIRTQQRIAEMVSLVKKEETQMLSHIKARKKFLEVFCWELLESKEENASQ